MKTNTARSKEYLEKNGWRCWTVEQMVRIPPRFGQPAKMFKRDVWNFGDLLCMHPQLGIALVQTTTRAHQAERIEKIRQIPEADTWIEAGGKLYVHGWAKVGPRGKAKRWEVSISEIGADAGEQEVTSHMERFEDESIDASDELSLSFDASNPEPF